MAAENHAAGHFRGTPRSVLLEDSFLVTFECHSFHNLRYDALSVRTEQGFVLPFRG